MARGIDDRPRSAAWQVHGRHVGRHSGVAARRRARVAACASTGPRCRLDGRGGEGQRLAGRAHSSGGGGQRRAAGSRAASGGSGAASPVLECLRAQGRGGSARERERREKREWREKIKVSGLTWSKLKIFN